MNYEEARNYLDQVSKGGSVLGLDNMRELLNRLRNPQDRLKFIHIAGTNGKGSVLAYLSTILIEAGYRTGRYISPVLFSYREKIQVDEKMIGREDLARLTAAVKEAAEDMKKHTQESLRFLKWRQLWPFFILQNRTVTLLYWKQDLAEPWTQRT